MISLPDRPNFNKKVEQQMTKEYLFLFFNINETHSVWDEQIDNWWIVEIYRIMKGELPKPDDLDCLYILSFLHKFKNDMNFYNEIRSKYPNNWGNLFLTAKRSVHHLSDFILADEHLDMFMKGIYRTGDK